MEIVEELNSNEKILALRAAAMHVPLAGTFELIPACNMNCRMCYIRTAQAAMKSQGSMLTAEEWIEIASEARDKGLLYLLLTSFEISAQKGEYLPVRCQRGNIWGSMQMSGRLPKNFTCCSASKGTEDTGKAKFFSDPVKSS